VLRAVLGFGATDNNKSRNVLELSKITSMLLTRKLRFIGHTRKRKDELAQILLLWEPEQENRKRLRQTLTFVLCRGGCGINTVDLVKSQLSHCLYPPQTNFRNYTGLSTDDLKTCVNDREK